MISTCGYVLCIRMQAPSILDTCTTSLISSYEVQIDYTGSDGRLTERSNVPGNITSILMSDYFPEHPLPDTNYAITVVAVNEGGRGITNAPTCMYICYCYVQL